MLIRSCYCASAGPTGPLADAATVRCGRRDRSTPTRAQRHAATPLDLPESSDGREWHGHAAATVVVGHDLQSRHTAGSPPTTSADTLPMVIGTSGDAPCPLRATAGTEVPAGHTRRP